MDNSFSLEISEEAKYDIFDAFLWYQEQWEGLGPYFQLCPEAGLFTLSRGPFIFEEKYQNIRVHFIERFPYDIHYFEHHSEIRVLGVFHTNRSPRVGWIELNPNGRG